MDSVSMYDQIQTLLVTTVCMALVIVSLIHLITLLLVI